MTLLQRLDEVVDKLVIGVFRTVDLGDCSQLRVGSEDQIAPCARPLDGTGDAIVTFERVLGVVGGLPLGAKIR